ncbi:MAG: carbohydrate binding family 9 domain-containing protein [Acidobacteria bacterium]|nr:carbohydrate binding family 9 domain-containing protein [Acidobacteriota bacterium]
MVVLGLVLAASLLLPPGAEGAPSTPPDIEAIRTAKRVEALRIAEQIRVDGVLDEPAWELAEPATDFYQQQPAEFQLSTRRTEVRFLYDTTTLYLGAMLYDDAPDRLITNDLKRDFGGRDGDLLGLVLDTFQDRRNAYGFLTNPGGAQRETLAYDNGRRNDANWHGVWFVRTAIRPDGWSAEFAIPFKTLRFPERQTQEWGLNLVRIIRRDNEITTWSPVPRQFTHYHVGYAGALVGIAGVKPGRNLQVKPFATGQIARGVLGDPGWSGDGDGGLDLKWGIRSSLALDGTYRTDFSQVEADEQQINLTRFSLFFPEKREFFLESPGSFQIGIGEAENQAPRRDLVPFFSRRIGLSSDGRPIPAIGGLRLTGRAGRQGIGILTMQTDSFEGHPGDNFTAVRITRKVSDTASMGAFYFGRESSGTGGFNRVAGLELLLAPRRTLEIEAFAMRSGSEGQAGDWAGRAGFRIDSSAHRARLGLLHVGDTFRHDLGFVRRRGIATLFGNYSRILRPADTTGRVREYSVGAEFEATGDDRYSRSLTRVGGLNYGMLFAGGGQLRAWVNSTFERLDAPFDIGSNLTIAPGVHRFEDVGVEYNSNRSARLSGSIEVGAGEFWTGRQSTVNGSARFRLSAHLAASANVRRSDVNLPQGSFAANLVGLRLDWSFTPRMFLNAFIQYNGETDAWLSNVRFNLIHRPLSDIYVVWNETRFPGVTRRALLLKYTHLIAF